MSKDEHSPRHIKKPSLNQRLALVGLWIKKSDCCRKNTHNFNFLRQIFVSHLRLCVCGARACILLFFSNLLEVLDNLEGEAVKCSFLQYLQYNYTWKG